MSKRKFLLDMHYFRAFAIINVVLVHIWKFPSTYEDAPTAKLITVLREVLFHDSTIYFIFISGFLFHYLSSSFNIKKYYKSKVTNVLAPYIFWTSAIFIAIGLQNNFDFNLKLFAFHLVYGTSQAQYWYIPFITLIFCISPIFIKMNEGTLTKLCILMSFLPLLGTRTGTHISLGQYAYFLPVYLIGIICSIHYDTLIEKCRQYQAALFAVTAITSGFIIHINYNSIPLKYGHFDILESLFYAQKISITFLIIIYLKKITKRYKLLDAFANLSFGLYFTHTLVFRPFILEYILDSTPGVPIVITSFAYATLCMFVTLGLMIITKKVLGTYSRMIAGI